MVGAFRLIIVVVVVVVVVRFLFTPLPELLNQNHTSSTVAYTMETSTPKHLKFVLTYLF